MNRIEGYFVRMKGLEPPCLAALDPKSSASTNSATSADKFQNLFRNMDKFMFMLSINTAMSVFCQINSIYRGWPEKWNAKLMINKILSISFPYNLIGVY
jgi:hypothetical protein